MALGFAGRGWRVWLWLSMGEYRRGGAGNGPVYIAGGKGGEVKQMIARRAETLIRDGR